MEKASSLVVVGAGDDVGAGDEVGASVGRLVRLNGMDMAGWVRDPMDEELGVAKCADADVGCTAEAFQN